MLTEKTVLALGADMKNRFLVASGNTLRFGPDINDLNDAQNYEVFKRSISKALKNIKPDIIARDLHPDYFSTQFAKTFVHSPSSVVHRAIQHHHAHMASVMLEHNLEKPVIGVCFDGTGFGSDSNIWGGEFLLVDRKGFKRLAHLKYNKMPGGERAIKEPWRMALGILGKKAIPFIRGVERRQIEAVLSMCEKNINSPLTSSAGRLFDAAAALLGVCTHASYEAEGPIKLESMCRDLTDGSYKFDISKKNGQYIIDPQGIFTGMLKDLKLSKNKKVIAAKFHNSMACIIVNTVKKLSRDTRRKRVALSGGVFQNEFLKKKTIKKLTSSGFRVFTNEKTPVNDLNISLGQYYVLSASGKS